jgi:hypothetical protein
MTIFLIPRERIDEIANAITDELPTARYAAVHIMRQELRFANKKSPVIEVHLPDALANRVGGIINGVINESRNV